MLKSGFINTQRGDEGRKELTSAIGITTEQLFRAVSQGITILLAVALESLYN